MSGDVGEYGAASAAPLAERLLSPVVRLGGAISTVLMLMIVGLAILLAVPGLATWLPYSAGFGRKPGPSCRGRGWRES